MSASTAPVGKSDISAAVQLNATSTRAKNNISGGVASISAEEGPLVVQADVLPTARTSTVEAGRERNRKVEAFVPAAGPQLTGPSAAPSTAPLHDPVAALQVLNKAYADAPVSEKNAILNNANSQKIIDGAAQWANEPLQAQVDGIATQAGAPILQAVARLDRATDGLDKALAAAIVYRAVSGYELFIKANQGKFYLDRIFGPEGFKTLLDVCSRIAGTPQGDGAISRFARTGAWDNNAVRNAIAKGEDPVYAAEYARQIQAEGQDPSIVLQAIRDGVMSIIGEGDTARQELGEHHTELAWLMKNVGAGVPPQQRIKAIADYRATQEPGWQAEEARLSQRVDEVGAKLLNQMAFLSQSVQFASGDLERILSTIVNSPTAGFAIAQALKTNPNLIKNVKGFADIFSKLKMVGFGRKGLDLLVSGYLKAAVLDRLEAVDLSSPAGLAQAKEAIGILRNGTIAHLTGVHESDFDKAVGEVEKAVGKVANGTNAEIAFKELDDILENDPKLFQTFNKLTFLGQVMRAVPLVATGAGLINRKTDDLQSEIRLIVDAVGFAQKSTAFLVDLGAISRGSRLAKFGGEWKLAAGAVRASAADLIAGVSAVLDGISAVRSAFGLGVEQDTVNAFFLGTSALGSGLTLAPAFGASAWVGALGGEITLLVIPSKLAYDWVKDAHKYEKVSRNFLLAGGYSEAAATALCRQAPLGAGSAQMPYLVKYARQLTPEQLQAWVNKLTPTQVNELSGLLLWVASDTHGNPDEFTDGPPQTRTIHTRIDGDYEVTRGNTFQAFGHELDRLGIPRV